MRQTWRWFGPADHVTTDDMLQAGVEGVVSALHHVPTGAVWSPEEIAKRQGEIARRRTGRRRASPGRSWKACRSPRTSRGRLATGAATLPPSSRACATWRARGSRSSATTSCRSSTGPAPTSPAASPTAAPACASTSPTSPPSISTCCSRKARRRTIPRHDAGRGRAAARRRWTRRARTELARNVGFGLPGAAERIELDDLRAQLAAYGGSAPTAARASPRFPRGGGRRSPRLGVADLLPPGRSAVPAARPAAGHVDRGRLRAMLAAVDRPANGLTLCAGSLGIAAGQRPAGDDAAARRPVHFLHLRNVTRESAEIPGSFHEAEHLGGDTDMVALVAAVIAEERRRQRGAAREATIPMRPDHGQDIVDDLRARASRAIRGRPAEGARGAARGGDGDGAIPLRSTARGGSGRRKSGAPAAVRAQCRRVIGTVGAY